MSPAKTSNTKTNRRSVSKKISSKDTLPSHDLTILRDLAREFADVSRLPVQKEKADLWRRLNRLERVRPMILLQNATWHETRDMFFQLQCENEWTRNHEFHLRASLNQWHHVRDDFVYLNVACSPIAIKVLPDWGVQTDATRPDHVFGACHYNPVLKGTEDPVKLIELPKVTVDQEETDRTYQKMCAIYDGIMPVKKQGQIGVWFAIMDLFIQWRGLDNMFLDMVDRPEWVHAWMNRMTERITAEWDQYDAMGLLSLNNGECGIANNGPGGHAITDILPQKDFDGIHVRSRDMWGHATTQIFAEVSPAMHDEFALKYEGRFLSRFGLNGYGCCEPLHLKVDLIRKRIPRLRRMSMSPWADVAMGAAGLKNEVIFSYKPNPAILGMSAFDINEARRQLKDVFEKTRGCVIEVIMKDLHTVNKQPNRMGEWVRMAIDLAGEYAG